MKRIIYLVHRWLGIILCLFMAMWFFSGVVMMYVGFYPRLTPAERLMALPPLNIEQCCAPLTDILSAAERKDQPKDIRLTTVAGQTRFILNYGKKDLVAVDAVSAKRIDVVNQSDALAAAKAFMPATPAHYDTLLEDEDAWTHSKGLDAQRPLHRIQMADTASTVLYVSGKTGEVARDVTAVESTWGWVGGWIHLLYPFRGGAVDKHWADIVIYISIVATILTLLGMFVGIWRWRFSGKFKTGARTPYREPWMRWHHIVGIVFGVTALTFIFSGLMSMNPFKVLDSGAPKQERRLANRNDIHTELFATTTQQALKKFTQSAWTPAELEWRMVDGEAYYLAYNSHGGTLLLAAGKEHATAQPVDAFSIEKMQAIGTAIMASSKVKEATVLRDFDFYYYNREPHSMGGNGKTLPILRLKFDDAYNTWIQLDPRTGAVINQTDSRRRLGRWLFSLLHNWDWLPLMERRPLWDIWMIVLSLGGFVMSITGVVIGWRRLRIKSAQVGNKRASKLVSP